MLTFTASGGQIPVAIVRNNYLNNWAFKEKIDCLKAVFCGESIRGNHFSCLLDIVFLLISTRKDAWFFGAFLLLGHWPVWWTMLRGEKSSNEQFRTILWFTVVIYIHFSNKKKKCTKIANLGCSNADVNYPSWQIASLFFFFGIVFIFTKLNYHLFRTWSWRRGEGRDDAEGYLPDKLLGDTKAWLIAKCEARQTGRTLSSYIWCESGLISRTARIQMIDSTSSMVWLGVSDEDDVVCGGGGGVGG